MNVAETELLDALMARLAVLEQSAAIDLDLLGTLPADVGAFEAMPPSRQSASRAVLKSFEQMEDQIARVFRLVPRLLGVDSSRWYARDHADFMEKLGVLGDAAGWSAIVRLRNELVHDYPIDASLRLQRLIGTVNSLAMLSEVCGALVSFIEAGRKERRL